MKLIPRLHSAFAKMLCVAAVVAFAVGSIAPAISLAQGDQGAQGESATGLTFTRTLQRRTWGDDVRQLQQFLKDQGVYPEGLVTGYFGLLTEAAVKRFQAQEGMRQTGRLDRNTRLEISILTAPATPPIASLTTTGTVTTTPTIIDIAMSDSITSSGRTTQPKTAFTTATQDIYAILALRGVTKDTAIGYIRYYAGGYVDSGMSHPSADNTPFFHFQWSLKPGKSRLAGDYTVVFYLNGARSWLAHYLIQ